MTHEQYLVLILRWNAFCKIRGKGRLYADNTLDKLYSYLEADEVELYGTMLYKRLKKYNLHKGVL